MILQMQRPCKPTGNLRTCVLARNFGSLLGDFGYLLGVGLVEEGGLYHLAHSNDPLTQAQRDQ